MPILIFFFKITLIKSEVKDVLNAGSTALLQQDLSILSIATSASREVKLILGKKTDPTAAFHVLTL